MLIELIPEVAVTIGGFAGLFVVLRQSRGGFQEVERFALYFLLLSSLGAAMLALLSGVLSTVISAEVSSRLMCLLTGLYILGISVWRLRYILAAQHAPRYLAARRILGFLQWLMIAAVLAAPLGVLPTETMFAAALWWLVFVAIVQFFMQIAASFSRPEDNSS